ncbi:Fc.00g096020.m01.CDS01 [Cosmosporella sp. VM-42]
MKSFYVLLATLTTLATAIFIDHTLQDGVYTVWQNPSNPKEHLLRREIHANHHTLVPRGGRFDNLTLSEELSFPKNKKFCWKGHDFNRSDLHPSIDNLFVEPLYWVPEGQVKFSLYGSVVTFMCNLGYINAASLLEFMEAMDQIDDKCGETVGGKISLTNWEKMYGRESRGEKICEWESEPGGIENNLMDVQACHTFVNGADHWFGRGEKCNANNGWSVWDKVKKKFPWYHNAKAEDEVKKVEKRDDDVKFMLVESQASKNQRKSKKKKESEFMLVESQSSKDQRKSKGEDKKETGFMLVEPKSNKNQQTLKDDENSKD